MVGDVAAHARTSVPGRRVAAGGDCVRAAAGRSGRAPAATGQSVLAAVGVVQTIPSLALLVFMIPLLGIGGWPAVAALFLYSLLPIVRNTHAGLTAIPPALRESAEALGLPRGAILWRSSCRWRWGPSWPASRARR